MAIGDVQAGIGGSRAYSSAGNTQTALSQLGEGVGKAVTNLAQAFGENQISGLGLAEAAQNRVRRDEKFDAQKRLIDYQSQLSLAYQDAVQNAPVDGRGFTNALDASVSGQNKAFLESLPPYLRTEFEPQLAQIQNAQVTSAYAFEISQGNQKYRSDITETMNTLGSAIKGRQTTFEDAIVQMHEMIDTTDLPEAEKESLYNSTAAVLGTMQFTNEVTDTVAGKGTVREPNTGDVVAAGLMPQERAMLNALGTKEGQYNSRWPSKTFEGYDDHPRILEDGPHGKSSAAGRYGFTATTWDAAVNELKAKGIVIPDFSPESQDRVAAYWVRRQFNRLNGEGLDFDKVMASGDRNMILKIRDVLGKPRGGNPNAVEWAGLGNFGDDEFIAAVTGDAGLAGGGTGMAQGPDIWTDPRYAMIGLDQKMQLAASEASQLQAQSTAAAAKAKADAEAALSSLLTQAYRGEKTTNDIPMLIASGQLADYEDEKKFRAAVDGHATRVASAGEFEGKLSSKEPITQSDKESFDNWVGDEGRNQLNAGNQEYFDSIKGSFAQAGFVPQQTRDVFAAMLNGSNMQAKTFALQNLAQLSQQNPSFMANSGFDSDTQATMEYFNSLSKYTSGPQEALGIISEAQKNAFGKKPTEVRKEALELFNEAVPNIGELMNKLDEGIFSSEPTAPTVGAAQRQLIADSQSAYYAGYLKFGTQAGAEAYMKSELKRNWSPSELNGGQLTKFAPETVYPSLDNSFDWISKQLRTDLGAQETDTLTVVPTPETEKQIADFRSGSRQALPSYSVVVTKEDGTVYVSPQAWHGEVTPFMKEVVQKKYVVENTQNRLDEVSVQISKIELDQHNGVAVPTQLGALEGLREDKRKLEVTLQELTGKTEERDSPITPPPLP